MNQKRIKTSQKIVNLKKNNRNIAEYDYLQAKKKMDSVQDRLNEKLSQIREAEQFLQSGQKHLVSVLELQSWHQFIEKCKQELVEVQSELTHHQHFRDHKQYMLKECYIDEQKWIEHTARLVQIRNKKIETDEQKQLDEFVIQRNSKAFG